MASVLLSAAGAALGGSLPGVGFLAGPLLGLAGGALGGNVDSALGILPATSFTGSRLGTIRLQDSREGATIARVHGTLRMAGNIIWSSPLIETANTERVGGGKGGSARATTYRYAAHVAVGICAGPVAAIHRIWADSKLIYDRGLNTLYTDAVRIYTGSATQTPDALVESFVGTGNAPAYRGTAYVVLENLKLEHYGNRIPNLTFEVEGFSTGYAPTVLGQTTHSAGAYSGNFNPRSAMAVSPTDVIIPGITILGGGNIQFTASDYSFNGSTFTLDATATSAVVTASGSEAYALSPDRTRIAYLYGNTSSITVAIYTIATRIFGTATTITPASGISFDSLHLAWLDNATLVIPATNGTTYGVHSFRAAGAAVIAESPLPYTSLFDAALITQSFPLLRPATALGTLIFCGTNFTNSTFAVARLSHANGSITASVFAPVTPAITGVSGGRTMAILPSAEIVYINDGGATWDISVYAITSEGLVLTRGGMVPVNGANEGILDICAIGSDRIVVLNANNTGGFRITELTLTASTIAISGTAIAATGAPALHASSAYLSRLGGNTLLLLNSQQLIAFTARRGDNTLAAIVDDIAAQLGMTIDTTDLASVRVAGFIMPDQQTARRALETLMAAYPFSITETDGILRALLLTSGSATTIPTTSRRASGSTSANAETPPSISTTRAQQAEIPTAVQVDYIDASNDYAAASVQAQRAAPPHTKVEIIGLPLVLGTEAAQSIATTTLARRVVEGEKISFTTVRDFLALDTNDRIIADGRTYRLTRLMQQGSLIKADAVRDDVSLLASVATLAGATAISLNDATLTSVYSFDLPALTDTADQPGIYIGATADDTWLGGIVYRSLAGLPPAEYTRLPRTLTLGYATTALPTGPTDYTDNTNTVTIALAYGTLASVTTLEMLNGANMALLGDEIIHFQTATLIAPRTYRLSTLLRARYGTESAMPLHQAGERFVLLESGALQFVPAALADRNRNATLQLLSSGQTLAESLPTSFTYTLNTLKPFAPVWLNAVRNTATNDVTLSWIRRARVNADWADNIDVPLDESTELYTVTILSSGTPIRTFTPTTTTQTYTAADQTTDFGSPPATLTFRVSQTSARYGSGQEAEITATF